jgi:hypothetical protein
MFVFKKVGVIFTTCCNYKFHLVYHISLQCWVEFYIGHSVYGVHW